MPLSLVRVISAGNGPLVVEASDGRTYTISGARSQRNNNPGAIAWSPVARQFGAIGHDNVTINGQRSTPLAIFPTMEAGRAAQQELLFGADPNHRQFHNMTLGQAISIYAPGGVDGNGPSSAYAQRIANSLGVSVNTRLSDLTPAQQSAFMDVQARIESGGRSAVTRDTQGNVVQFPPANIPNVRLPPNSSGGPDDRTNGNQHWPASYTPIPLAPLPSRPAQPMGNAGDALAFAPYAGSMADALPLAYGRVPQFANASGSPDDRDSLAQALPPELPAAALANVPLPIPRPQHQPQATIAAPAIAPPPQTWTAPSGHVYTVGDTLRTGGGTYVVTPSGIQKVGYTSPTGNQANILNSVVGHAIGDAMQGGVAQAKQAGASLLNDAQGVLNWFTGGGNPVSVAPSPQTPSVPALNVNVSGLLGNLFKSPPPSIPGTSAASAASVPQTYGPAGGYYSPPTSSLSNSSWAAPYYASVPSLPFAGGDPFNPPTLSPVAKALNDALNTTPYGGYIPGGIPTIMGGGDPFGASPSTPLPQFRDLGISTPTAPAAPTTKTVYTTKTETVANPAYQTWLADQSKPAMYGVEGVPTPTLDANGNVVLPSSYLGASTPAPPKTITKTIRVPTTVTVPALKAPIAPVVPLSPPEDELRALREAQMNPFQRLFNASPLGHVVNFFNGSDQAYGGTTGGLLSMFARGMPSGGGGLLGALSQPAYKANNAASLINLGLTPSQANTYAAGGAAMQGAYPNPVVAQLTGALNRDTGSIAAPSTGGVISPFHSF